MNSFHRDVGSYPWAHRQPEQAPLRQPELPGEFVDDELRADCARFLDDARTLVRRRAALPPASPGWLPGRVD